jgi:excisionase family DNA binding protein
LTLAEAANELGVHYMTAYRYVRLGKVPARKEGRDWRIRQDDLDRLTSRSPADVPGATGAPWHDRFLNRLSASDEQGAWLVVEAALASGLDPIDAYTAVVIPALRQVGDLWEAGQVTVAQEHAATGVCQRIVGRLGSKSARRGVSRGTIVLGCPANEPHGLAAAIAADSFRFAGYDVIDCGPNVPPDSFVGLSSTTPRLVATGISATTTGGEVAIAKTIDALRAGLDVPIILGGRAVDSLAMAQDLGADLWAATAAEGVTRLHELLH